MPHSQEIQQIIDFVEGRLNAKEFEQLVYTNPRFEEILNDNPGTSLNSRVWGNFYLFIIEKNFDSPHDVHEVHHWLTEYLERHEISVQPTDSHQNLYGLLSAAQPKWLNVDSAYLRKEFLNRAEERQGNELKEWLKAELIQAFQCVDKPPRWKESPAWPINENGPLLFLGQLKIKDYFHEMTTSVAYLFYDTKTGKCETVIQV